MISLVFLSVLLSQTQVEERPACTASVAGQLWPSEANQSPAALQRAARAGKLWICSRATWRYRWEQAAVSLEQLKKERESKRKNAETASAERRR
jgi:hypothetical protein